MALTKVTTKGITDNAVDGDKLAPGSVTTAKIGCAAVESSEINNGTVTADDLASTLDLSPKTVTLAGGLVDTLKKPVQDNIALLGFKMAVNDGLTVFNLVDGVVDEFHSEDGTDEAESSNDHYCASNDFYTNNLSCSPYSAGFTMTTTTEEDTSEAGTNPASHPSSGSSAEYTVPSCVTSVNLFAWGSGGGGPGGGGGFASGTLAVTAGQKFEVLAGEGGNNPPGTGIAHGGFLSGGSAPNHPSQSHGSGGGGGGLSGVFADGTVPSITAPQAYIVAGSGGGGGHGTGGAGGGTTGDVGEGTTEQTSASGGDGGGGSQTSGGQGGSGCGTSGGLFSGGPTSKNDTNVGAGGAGYYGGGGGGHSPGQPVGRAGGGGSSYFGHPQITSGATEEGQGSTGGGTGNPNYVACTNEGGSGTYGTGEDGFVLITGSFQQIAQPGGGSSTIISNAFAANAVPTTSRIVVFQENIDSPTLNTDIIASVSRNGGSNFTTATLTDSGYVTGSSGQRILTGQATISGQPSGQSMRWKLALANNSVKIHGVSLQWA